MTKNGFFLLFLSLLLTDSLIAQDTKGIYVNDFKNIVGNTEKENELLTHAQQEGFNYLLLYNLHAINQNQFDISDLEAAKPLADFIEKAKTEYGVMKVGAVGEKRSSFNKIISYNNNHSNNPNQQFDILNIEFEFWNNKLVANYYYPNYLKKAGLPNNIDGAFQFYIDQIKQTNELCSQHGLKSETYIGQITESQGKELGENCDRVLVHYYKKSDVYSNGNSLYNYKSDRLSKLAPDNGILKILPIFAATTQFMGPWLSTHSVDEAFNTYMNGQNGYNESTGDWKNHIAIDGFQWYAYTHLLQYSGSAGSRPTDSQNHMTIEERMLPNTSYNGSSLQETDVKLFPNQKNSSLFIQCPLEASLRLITAEGKVLRYIEPKEPKVLDFSDKDDGIYFLTIQFKKELVIREITLKHN